MLFTLSAFRYSGSGYSATPEWTRIPLDNGAYLCRLAAWFTLKFTPMVAAKASCRGTSSAGGYVSREWVFATWDIWISSWVDLVAVPLRMIFSGVVGCMVLALRCSGRVQSS